MNPESVTVKQLSLCPCGFPVLKADIQLGTTYVIHRDNMVTLTLICGGCRRRHLLSCVWCDATPNGDEGYLPIEIFQEPRPPGGSLPRNRMQIFREIASQNGYSATIIALTQIIGLLKGLPPDNAFAEMTAIEEADFRAFIQDLFDQVKQK